MALKRMDNVGIVVDDIGGTIDFFRELGLEPCQVVEQKRLVGTNPIFALTKRLFAGMGIPSSSMLPEVGGATPISIRMAVVLPAPLGPRKPKKEPFGTSRSSPSTAAFVP